MGMKDDPAAQAKVKSVAPRVREVLEICRDKINTATTHNGLHSVMKGMYLLMLESAFSTDIEVRVVFRSVLVVFLEAYPTAIREAGEGAGFPTVKAKLNELLDEMVPRLIQAYEDPVAFEEFVLSEHPELRTER